MRKTWNKPEMDVLNITETANGTSPINDPDGEVYQDPADGLFKQKMATATLSN